MISRRRRRSFSWEVGVTGFISFVTNENPIWKFNYSIENMKKLCELLPLNLFKHEQIVCLYFVSSGWTSKIGIFIYTLVSNYGGFLVIDFEILAIKGLVYVI